MKVRPIAVDSQDQRISATSTYSAFFMEGVFDQDYDKVILTWGNGCIELVSEIVAYASHLHCLVGAAEKARNDSTNYPGVIEYEVCAPFGRWIGKYVIAHGTMPAKRDCYTWLASSVIEFFNQCEVADQAACIRNAVEHQCQSFGFDSPSNGFVPDMQDTAADGRIAELKAALIEVRYALNQWIDIADKDDPCFVEIAAIDRADKILKEIEASRIAA
jgi:hypothetical protein